MTLFVDRNLDKPCLLFSSLICHRDVDIFILNWFTMRVHLTKGFDIPHLILHDGTLTAEDKLKLEKLTKVVVLDKPVVLHPVPKPVYLAKLMQLKLLHFYKLFFEMGRVFTNLH